MAGGLSPQRSCDVAVVLAVSDDQDVQQALGQVVRAIFPE